MKNICIAIDGPAGAGKSTIAKKIACIKKLVYIDTGAMYRALTLKLLKDNIPLDDEKQIKQVLDNTTIEIINGEIFLDSINVNEDIRTPLINENVSIVAALQYVREKMVYLQREIAKNNNVVMDGRDIGTRVLKDANYKFFLTASIKERAMRRYKELLEKGYNFNYDSVVDDMSKRDKMDSEREIDPLRIAEDAILIDTTGKTIEQVINEILDKSK